MRGAQTYYEVLGVSPHAELAVIDGAYRALIKKYHPDVRERGGRDRSAEINEAYSVLRDPRKRMEYDRKLGIYDRSPVVTAAHRGERRSEKSSGSSQSLNTKECPDCAERVQRSARVCRFCGFVFFGDREEPKLIRAVAEPRRSPAVQALLWLGGILVLLMLIGVLLGDPGGEIDDSGLSNVEGTEPGAEQIGDESNTQDGIPDEQPLRVSEMLRNGDPRACSAPEVLNTLTETILSPLDAISDSNASAKARSQIKVRLSELGQLAVDRETAQMGCSANVHIDTPTGSRTLPMEYVVRPSLEPKYDFLVSGDWQAAQTVVSNVATLQQFFGTEQAPPPDVVSDGTDSDI